MNQPEPYSTKHIIAKHTGVMEVAIHVLGRSAHISRMEEGINAIAKAARVVPALEAVRITGQPDPDLPGLPRMNVGTISAGADARSSCAARTSCPMSARSSSTSGSR